ncbi:MAG: hypothetical protein ACOYJL_03440 [Tractidigestivibacter sp.]|uniref:hypothetical protein n=1 Tax=Tractidigestivibacter sp. TaxID=2847320 RepID=UPI003D8ECB0A
MATAPRDSEMETAMQFFSGMNKWGFLGTFLAVEGFFLIQIAPDVAAIDEDWAPTIIAVSIFLLIWSTFSHATVIMLRGMMRTTRIPATVLSVIYLYIIVSFVLRGGLFSGLHSILLFMFAPFVAPLLIQAIALVAGLFSKGEKDGDEQLADSIRKDATAQDARR